MKEIGTIWIAEAEEYEGGSIYGVYNSRPAAILGIKERYPLPYLVRWEEVHSGLIGTFDAVEHLSTNHTGFFSIRCYPLMAE